MHARKGLGLLVKLDAPKEPGAEEGLSLLPLRSVRKNRSGNVNAQLGCTIAAILQIARLDLVLWLIMHMAGKGGPGCSRQ